MKYTLAKNAVSSLSIAIENFKKFYYFTDEYSQSEQDESTKICIIFLENAIELLLKTILVSTDPKVIYKNPESQIIRKAETKVNETLQLEDILISEGNFQTITYTDAVKIYNNHYYKSEKVFNILDSLGKTRNAITHFGIDRAYTWDELIICILNSFDVIYNYLYPQLIKLEDIAVYFTSDDLFVNTIHGVEPLFDDDFVYNNIVDFLDELMGTSKEYICSLRATNPNSKISEFTELIKILLEDKKFEQMLAHNNVHIKFYTCDFENNDFGFEFHGDLGDRDAINSCYSPYFNVTAFCGECGNIYFLIEHDKHELYIYDRNNFRKWTQHDEAEPDKQWLKDFTDGFCNKFNLSKRNLMLAFENIIMSIDD